MIHDLKLLPQFFKAVEEGKKKFEIRKNDRNFHEGDTVILHEWSDAKGYTGYQITKKIGFITDYEQKPGHVVFGLE
jgi:ASC-1-like (ASCH) protein